MAALSIRAVGAAAGGLPAGMFALASAAHVQVRHLRPSVPTLEDVFAHAVGQD